MNPPQIRAVLLSGSVLLVIAGCATLAPPPVVHGLSQVHAADRDAVFDAAEAALITEGFRIDQRDRAAGLLSTYPMSGAGDEPLPSTWRRRAALRRVAQVRVVATSGGAQVHCRVVLQEQATLAHRLYAQEHGVSDLPSDTPVDRAAVSSDQNTVWRLLQRDKAAERRILTAIDQTLAGTDAPDATTPAPADPSP